MQNEEIVFSLLADFLLTQMRQVKELKWTFKLLLRSSTHITLVVQEKGSIRQSMEGYCPDVLLLATFVCEFGVKIRFWHKTCSDKFKSGSLFHGPCH